MFENRTFNNNTIYLILAFKSYNTFTKLVKCLILIIEKMKINLFLLLFSFTTLYAQDSTQILSQEVIYYKNPRKQTKKRKKAYLKQVNTIYKDSTHKEEMLRLSDGSVYYRRIFKNDQPIGTWIETTNYKQVTQINTEKINYCINEKWETSFLKADSTLIDTLSKEIYYTIVQSMQYPDLPKDLNLSGIVYIHFELTPKDNIENRCVFKSVHPILDLVALNTINGLREFDNPLDRRINFKIPLRYRLR